MKIEIEIEENYITVDGIKYLPEAEIDNKTKLKTSIWYKSLDYPKWMFCVTNINYKEKRVKGYGFGADGNWMGNAQNDSWEFNEFDKCIEMSEQEVFEALKNEAVKRGFVGDVYVDLSDIGFKNDDLLIESEMKLNGIYLDYGTRETAIFKNGKWSKVVSITKQEAEKQLGKKIID